MLYGSLQSIFCSVRISGKLFGTFITIKNIFSVYCTFVLLEIPTWFKNFSANITWTWHFFMCCLVITERLFTLKWFSTNFTCIQVGAIKFWNHGEKKLNLEIFLKTLYINSILIPNWEIHKLVHHSQYFRVAT